jgi:cellulose synthase/poly-beta-1,6-N-acetylglucosamine synthase-like glycosyltransferase
VGWVIVVRKSRVSSSAMPLADEPPVPHRSRVVIVMPAYNAARTLERTYADIPHDIVDRVILVDDVSRDDTVGTAATRRRATTPRWQPVPTSWSCSTRITSTTRPGSPT